MDEPASSPKPMARLTGIWLKGEAMVKRITEIRMKKALPVMTRVLNDI